MDFRGARRLSAWRICNLQSSDRFKIVDECQSRSARPMLCFLISDGYSELFIVSTWRCYNVQSSGRCKTIDGCQSWSTHPAFCFPNQLLISKAAHRLCNCCNIHISDRNTTPYRCLNCSPFRCRLSKQWHVLKLLLCPRVWSKSLARDGKSDEHSAALYMGTDLRAPH